MATEESDAGGSLDRMNENLAKIEALTQRLVAALASKREIDPSLQGPGQELYAKAAAAWMAQMMADPSRLIESQVGYWGRTMKNYVEAQKALAEGRPAADPGPDDRRFSNEMWQVNPWFNFLKQQYLMNSEAISSAVDDLAGLDDREKKKLGLFLAPAGRHDEPDQFPRHQPRGLGAGGRDRGPEPGRRAGEPGARHRGQSGRRGGDAGRQGRLRGRPQSGHRAGQGGVPQPHAGTDPVFAHHRRGL